MKILIVGFGRSGTTMTYRMIGSHRMVKGAFLETCHLAFNSKEKLLKKYPAFNKSCVEKIIYGGDKLSKRRFGKLDISIFDYCNMWLDYFQDEARIVQIIRHPLDTLASLIIKRGRRTKIRQNLKNIKITDIPLDMRIKLMESYFHVVPKFPKMIAKLPQTKTFKYEDIVLKSNETVRELFNFCELRGGHGPAMRRDRAFNYKRSGFRTNYPIKEVVKAFNQISDGIEYKIPRGVE